MSFKSTTYKNSYLIHLVSVLILMCVFIAALTFPSLALAEEVSTSTGVYFSSIDPAEPVDPVNPTDPSSQDNPSAKGEGTNSSQASSMATQESNPIGWLFAQTGDSLPLVLMVVILCISSGAVLSFYARKRRTTAILESHVRTKTPPNP